MTLPLPAPLTEYRALDVFDTPPAGYMTVPVPTDRFSPHLKAGELAVIDVDDNEPVHGEIYVVKIASPREPEGYRLRFVQLRRKEYDFVLETVGGLERDPDIGWMMDFSMPRHRGPMTREQVVAGMEAKTITLSDGPLKTDGMRRYIVGRVVGVVL